MLRMLTPVTFAEKPYQVGNYCQKNDSERQWCDKFGFEKRLIGAWRSAGGDAQVWHENRIKNKRFQSPLSAFIGVSQKGS